MFFSIFGFLGNCNQSAMWNFSCSTSSGTGVLASGFLFSQVTWQCVFDHQKKVSRSRVKIWQKLVSVRVQSSFWRFLNENFSEKTERVIRKSSEIKHIVKEIAKSFLVGSAPEKQESIDRFPWCHAWQMLSSKKMRFWSTGQRGRDDGPPDESCRAEGLFQHYWMCRCIAIGVMIAFQSITAHPSNYHTIHLPFLRHITSYHDLLWHVGWHVWVSITCWGSK